MSQCQETTDACRGFQAELDDPTSTFRRGVEATLTGPWVCPAFVDGCRACGSGQG